MKQITFYTIAIFFLLFVTGCVVGRKLSFDNSTSDLSYTPSGKIAIVFQDKREQILSGAEKQSFCGHMYAGYAIAYNVQTESGNPVAEDFAKSIQKTLSQKNVLSNTFNIAPTGDMIELMKQFQQSGYDKLLLFTINRWESRCTALFSKMRYETNAYFTLQVIDKNANTLASQEVKDILVREQGAGASVKVLQSVADECFKKQMQDLLNNDKIQAVLQ